MSYKGLGVAAQASKVALVIPPRAPSSIEPAIPIDPGVPKSPTSLLLHGHQSNRLLCSTVPRMSFGKKMMRPNENGRLRISMPCNDPGGISAIAT